MGRAIVVGILLGVAVRCAYQLPAEWHWVAKAGVPWLVVAFAIGASARSPLRAAARGALCLAAAILVYYAIMGLVQHKYDDSPLGLAWLVVALPGGALFGALGAVWRSGRAVVPIAALMSAALAAEALLFALWHTDGLAAAVLLAAAAGAPVVLVGASGSRLRACSLALALTFVALVAEAVLIRAAGYLS